LTAACKPSCRHVPSGHSMYKDLLFCNSRSKRHVQQCEQVKDAVAPAGNCLQQHREASWQLTCQHTIMSARCVL
jgi:hypothetical protein